MTDSEKKTYGFEFELDDFQKEAAEHISNGKSVVVCAPTGAGKTVIAEHAIIKAIEQNKRVFYTTPLKALSNQKFNDFAAKYGEERAGLLTGDTSVNRDAQIVVMTTEVFRNMLYGTSLGKVEENLKNVQYIILDEVHYMNDEQRGTVWEESIIYCPNNIQIVALSATIANAGELTDWINSVHGETVLVSTDFRPVPLRHFYYAPSLENKIVPLFTQGQGLNKSIKPEKRQPFHKRSNDEGKSHVKLVKALGEKDMLPAIYFAFSRKKCNKYMEDCAKLKLLNHFEERRLAQIVDEYVLDNPYLAKSKQLEYLYSGVASHHAGLLPGWKGLIEKLFKQGLIKVVFATETLAAGINMPARTTIISSISKRSDDGHRILTPSEFLQMSGRAGRRGMDEVGYVVTVGDAFHKPEEIAELASSQANNLESRFTPSYSMVLNLLQRFSLEDTRELILKSFGYYTSTARLKGLYTEQERIRSIVEEIQNFHCPFKLTNQDLEEYNKNKNLYVQTVKIAKTLKRQAIEAGVKDAPEVIEYQRKAKELYDKVYGSNCEKCKKYKKHIKDLDVLPRFMKKYRRMSETIDYEKDIYWRQFLNLMKVAEITEHLQDNYPTKKGMMTATARTENEIYFIELVQSGILSDLSYSELAAVLCAVVTEDSRKETYQQFKISKKIRKALHECNELMKAIIRIQQSCDVQMPILLNPDFSSLIERWVLGEEWDALFEGVEIGEGDVVRVFKRTIDLLRQLTNINGVPEELVKTAGLAIDCINRDPICDIF
jgi:superfamily II RNA helicase